MFTNKVGKGSYRHRKIPMQTKKTTFYCELEGYSEEDQNISLLLVDVQHWPVVANSRRFFK